MTLRDVWISTVAARFVSSDAQNADNESQNLLEMKSRCIESWNGVQFLSPGATRSHWRAPQGHMWSEA